LQSKLKIQKREERKIVELDQDLPAVGAGLAPRSLTLEVKEQEIGRSAQNPSHYKGQLSPIDCKQHLLGYLSRGMSPSSACCFLSSSLIDHFSSKPIYQ